MTTDNPDLISRAAVVKMLREAQRQMKEDGQMITIGGLIEAVEEMKS